MGNPSLVIGVVDILIMDWSSDGFPTISHAIHQRRSSFVHRNCCSSTDLFVGLQWSMQQVSNTLLWCNRGLLLCGMTLHSNLPNYSDLLSLIFCVQFEVASQFFVGSFDNSETYFDDIKLIMIRNLTSVTGFWFDLLTSMPWSFMDVNAYKVDFVLDRLKGDR